MSPLASLSRFAYVALLYDVYGVLLTEKQGRIIEMHFLRDLSLSEIGKELGISRQAAGILINRTEKILLGYEKRLGLVNMHFENEKKKKRVLFELDEIAGTKEINSDFKTKITNLINYISEEA